MSGRRRIVDHSSLQTLKAGTLYFALVFAAGFVLGTIRTIWIAPYFGTRNAELMEAPVMFVVTVPSAQWAARRLTRPPSWARRLAVGLVALGLLLSCGIYGRPLDQRAYDHTVPCRSGPGCGNGVCRDACSFRAHAASLG
jgi:hypothetical protein